MPSAPDIEIPLTNGHARESSGSSSEGGDIFMTIETCGDGNDDFSAIEQPKPLGRKESLQKERQISVDPISLKGATVRQASFTLVSPQHPSAKPPPKLKFVSTCSLPSSASSSPRSGSSSLLKKIWKNESEGSPRGFSHQHASVDDADLACPGSGGRSKSMIDDFDLTLDSTPRTEDPSHSHSHSHPEDRRRRPRRAKQREIAEEEDGFKCGKLCLCLPRGRGRGKGKPVKGSSSSSVSPLPPPGARPQAISRTVSLERFDCGSVSDSREPTNLFFDLPLELIRCSVSDMQSPVTAAFVFDKEPKGVLKKTTSTGSAQGRNSKSQETRHVRFSTSSPTAYPSSPTCITPRLRKARADFSSFIEAQAT